MSEPRDQRLFELTAAVVSDALGFVEKSIASKRTIRPHAPWATVNWSEGGMPEFSFAGIEAPLDYKDAFNPLWGLFMRFGRKNEEKFDFDAMSPFKDLKQYISSSPTIREGFLWSKEHTGMLSTSVKIFVEYLVDRYIHVIGKTCFDLDEFLPVYLPLETGLILESLPIEIVVPILHVSLPSDLYEIAEGVAVSRMSEPLQLARAIRAHDTDEVNEHVLQQASHSFVLSDYVLPNDHGGRFLSYAAETFPLDVIDAFFAALRIVTSIETGYAQLLIAPVGWAHSYTADLLPLEGTTIRRYPPGLHPINAIFGTGFPQVSDAQFASVRGLFADICAIRNSRTEKSSRLRLAIKRLNSCFLRENEEDAILDATIGMEILLSDGGTQEITHKLALRLAALSSLLPKYQQQTTAVFRNVKGSIYPYRSAVVHGHESNASKKREIKTEAGEAIPAVKLATEYLGMAVQAVALHPEFLDPSLIDEKLLLGRTAYS
jgi:hypothetical protein